jgi:hypothetical protein
MQEAYHTVSPVDYDNLEWWLGDTNVCLVPRSLMREALHTLSPTAFMFLHYLMESLRGKRPISAWYPNTTYEAYELLVSFRLAPADQEPVLHELAVAGWLTFSRQDGLSGPRYTLRLCRDKIAPQLSSTAKLRAIEQAGGICTYCRRKGTAASDPDGKSWVRDHIVPRCRGGRAKNNLALACTRCNSQKGSKSVEDFLAYMKAERGAQYPE